MSARKNTSQYMIGVLAAADDVAAAQEFFELFKTPWEPAVPGRRYSAVLTTDADSSQFDAAVVIVYSSVARSDEWRTARRVEGPTEVHWRGSTFPLYGRALVFDSVGAEGATCSGRSLEYESRRGVQKIYRVGYDLFSEVRRLLTDGQPTAHALNPTLELHIDFLRSILAGAGVTFVEVPPRPYGYDFTCCLTHDLDFFGIRRHLFDRTMFGFVYRATLGTLLDLLAGKRLLSEAVRNWLAVLKLPFIVVGLLPDPWCPTDDYSRADAPGRSTFFVVPFKDTPGIGPDGVTHRTRAVAYQASDVEAELMRAAARGSEIALHGLDAWRSAASGDRELKALTSVTGQASAGIRMHWLYFNHDAPAMLEAAGFTYDSTWGYNDAVGYRAGTSQVFKLVGTRALLELPLSIMDSALLFPDRMNLASGQASTLCKTIVETCVRFGGTLVINWHDRSLAPERQWNRCYQTLLSDISRSGTAWFATGAQAVDWYRWRRSITFTREGHSLDVSVQAGPRDPALPAAVLRTCGPSNDGGVSTTDERFDSDCGTLPIRPASLTWQDSLQAS
jgi:hypothetical protein